LTKWYDDTIQDYKMQPLPSFVKMCPKKTKNIQVALNMFCASCPVKQEYDLREKQLQDMKHPCGVLLIGEQEGTMFEDRILNEIRDVCALCLKSNYAELDKGIKDLVAPHQ
jgi:hypothetical protein